MRLHRLTAFVFFAPRFYVEDDPSFWGDIDIVDWSYEFDWEEDDWNGLKDIAKKPRETFASKSGDCEDYALVAASWAVSSRSSRDAREGVGLGFCFNGLRAEHVIAYDDERVYSSGVIRRVSPDEYIQNSDDYNRVVTRPV